MKNWLNKTTKYWSDKLFWKSILSALILLLISEVVSFYAGLYATRVAGPAVTDIILDHVPVFNVDILFAIFTAIVVIVSTIILIIKPEKLPFSLKALSLFVLIRSFFVILTHIGPFPIEAEKTSHEFINQLLFGSDRFFSGHTGMPFLGALIFWEMRKIRYFYLLSSLCFAFIVLLGHLHYSIDVMSAFFITYSIFHLSIFFFKKDWMLSKE